jgi:hypothetical protein
MAQTQDINLSFILLRLASLGVGVLLAWRQYPFLRGHLYLDGKTVPVLWGVIGGVIVSSQVTVATLLMLMGMSI